MSSTSIKNSSTSISYSLSNHSPSLRRLAKRSVAGFPSNQKHKVNRNKSRFSVRGVEIYKRSHPLKTSVPTSKLYLFPRCYNHCCGRRLLPSRLWCWADLYRSVKCSTRIEHPWHLRIWERRRIFLHFWRHVQVSVSHAVTSNSLEHIWPALSIQLLSLSSVQLTLFSPSKVTSS